MYVISRGIITSTLPFLVMKTCGIIEGFFFFDIRLFDETNLLTKEEESVE